VSEWSDPFGAITKPDPMNYAINDIHVTSSLASPKDHPIDYLTDLKLASEWETIDGVSEDKPLELNFAFNHLEHLSRMVWVPRKIDHQGDPVEVSVELSSDGVNFKPYGDHLTWKSDSKNKVVGLRNVDAKAIRLKVYKSSGPFVAAKEVIFFRDKK
ncbi:discoidin domain-containing protein, partial [Lactobacillus crispatus]